MEREKEYQIALSLLSGIGPIRAKQIVSRLNGVSSLFEMNRKEVAEKLGVVPSLVDKMKREEALSKAVEEIKFIEKNGVSVHYYLDKNYPEQLKFCEDSPIVLYTLGAVDFTKQNLAVVGTRKVSRYGIENTKNLISAFAGTDIQIISGLAHGVDRFAHEAALENGLSTIGILGHGLKTMYPAAHRPLANKMLKSGGLVTEFPSDIYGDPKNFPRRNRVVAGMSHATVIVESANRGGSLITANYANDYSREVFAFPGNINLPNSEGCNELIRRNKAHLVTSGKEILKLMEWETTTKKSMKQAVIDFEVTKTEKGILSLLSRDKSCSLQELKRGLRVRADEIMISLFDMEVKGRVRQGPGDTYSLA